MTASDIHTAEPGATSAFRTVARLTGTVLCLATAAVLVVTLRLGVYEYFHGEGRVFTWMWDVLH